MLFVVSAIYVYAEATQRHFEVALLYMNPTVKGKVVEPFEVVGALTVEFSVLTQVIVSVTPLKSKIRTIEVCPSTAPVVVIVIVRVAAELFVTVFTFEVTGTVAALLVAVMALLVEIICVVVWTPVNVLAASVLANVAEVDGKVYVCPAVPV